MKILILLKSFNYPPRNGGDQAVFNAIDRLSGTVQFHLIGTDGSDCGRRSMASFCEEHPRIPGHIFDLSKKDSYQRLKYKCNRVSNFLNNRSGNKAMVDMRLVGMYDARLDYYFGFYKYLNEYIVKNKIDIVQAEFHFTLGYLKGISVPVKKVFVQHEIQFVVERQRLMQRRHTDDEVYFYQQQRQQEINAMNACDAIITLSQDDKDKLIANGVHAPIYASFAQITLHDVDVTYPIEIKRRLVFIGPESHIPNKQGLAWFLDEVFPVIKKRIPDVTLSIIGRWSSLTMDEWKRRYSGVDFLGYVDNLPAAISGSVLIVPLFQGSGIRMKILEACNAGIPFVSTSIGAEGLGFVTGKNCFIDDTAEGFANDVHALLSNRKLANEFVMNSIGHIRSCFSDNVFSETRMRCYKETIGVYGSETTGAVD